MLFSETTRETATFTIQQKVDVILVVIRDVLAWVLTCFGETKFPKQTIQAFDRFARKFSELNAALD